jgi:endonuclease/exonuclease/phosphatase family metal-dependent hydrolase
MTSSPPTIRFLTWNVHGCVGRDGVCDPDRVASVLEAAQPDVTALQEIDTRTARTAHDPFSYFGTLFGWTTVAARTLSARDGHYGHIVLSRWPIESLGEIDLSIRWREPRKAIVGAVTSPNGRIVVVAAHLGLLPFERRRQFERLRKRIETIAERPLVVLGDFNDFPGRGLAERSLCPPLNPTPELATYPSRLPLLPLDRIWFSAPLALKTIATIRDAGRVSDHLPLLASLCWVAEESADVGTGLASSTAGTWNAGRPNG